MIRTWSFWVGKAFEAFVAHLKFVAEHHRQIEGIVIVTDSEFLRIMPPRRWFDISLVYDGNVTWTANNLHGAQPAKKTVRCLKTEPYRAANFHALDLVSPVFSHAM